MRRDPLADLFPGLARRPATFALRRERAPDDDRDDDGTDHEDATLPPRHDRRPTDGSRGYRNDTGRGRRGRRRIHNPSYFGNRLL